jgi:hypothetical protein
MPPGVHLFASAGVEEIQAYNGRASSITYPVTNANCVLFPSVIVRVTAIKVSMIASLTIRILQICASVVPATSASTSHTPCPVS